MKLDRDPLLSRCRKKQGAQKLCGKHLNYNEICLINVNAWQPDSGLDLAYAAWHIIAVRHY